MKKILMLLCLMACVLGMAPGSHAAIIDFDVLTDVDTKDAGMSYTEDGFLLTDMGEFPFIVYGTGSGFFSGSTALLNDNSLDGVTVLTRFGGGTFALNSISLAELFAFDNSDYAYEVIFTGLLVDGTSVEQAFTIDNLTGVQDFNFNSSFTNLASASWTQVPYYYQFDNINVTPVPEPCSMLLIGTGLIGLAGFKKRFTKRGL
jgi:hypothetical protein